MAYLSQYSPVLTADTAAHLLRRATAGPTKAEIASFTGKTALEAYNILKANIDYNPSPPIVLKETSPYYKQPFVTGPFRGADNFDWSSYVKYWWHAQLIRQDTPPSLLEKLAVFWQNHFVTTREMVSDYRYVWRYLDTIRQNALGNFKTFVKVITKDPAMLLYLNGNENVKGSPNENYARELQELFTVGEKDFVGNLNYTEDDVKAAARVLTGWSYTNHWQEDSTSFGTTFDLSKHDITNKVFSGKYSNTTITGVNSTTGGDTELNALTDMLMAHPEAPKFIVRKLYKWYVNPTVTQDIETNVIIPLANFFKSASNNFAIEPVLQKLLTSDIFYNIDNIGAIIKSPLELMAGSLRLFNFQVPNMTTETIAFRKYLGYLDWRMHVMQMSLIDQPSVFGWEPFYQNSLSRAWIASSTVAIRNSYATQYIWGSDEIPAPYKIELNLVEWAKSLQPNFLSPTTSPAITADALLEAFSEKMFVTPLFPTQKEFLIITILLFGSGRGTWNNEWNTFRTLSNNPTGTSYTNSFNGIRWRLQSLMLYMLKMAEFQVF